MEIDEDWYELPSGGIGVHWRTEDYLGHKTVRCGTALCPRCERHTHVYHCADLRCDGEVTSYRHEERCPPVSGAPNKAAPAGE